MVSGRGGKRGGAGRPATGRTTRVLRVPLDITPEEIAAIPSLRNAIADWRAKCAEAKSDAARYWFLNEMLKELEKYGY